jgi:hypothetical protein
MQISWIDGPHYRPQGTNKVYQRLLANLEILLPLVEQRDQGPKEDEDDTHWTGSCADSAPLRQSAWIQFSETTTTFSASSRILDLNGAAKSARNKLSRSIIASA